MSLLAACAAGGGGPHGTALHHLGGPGDGVMIPDAASDGTAPVPAPVPVPGPEPAAPLPAPAKRSAAGSGAATKAAPATPAGPFAPPPEDKGAAIDEVVVTPLDISGYWKVTARTTFGLGDGAYYARYDKDTHICRFEQRRERVLAYCPLLDAVGDGVLDGRHLSLSWALATGIAFHVDAEIDGPDDALTFSGQASGRLVGLVPVTARVPASAVRFTPPDGVHPPSLEPLRQALRDWDTGRLTPGLYTPAIVDRLGALSARSHGAGRGDLVSLRYVGQIDRALNKTYAPDARITHDVYEARYQGGTWLCVVHVGDDGRISDFAC